MRERLCAFADDLSDARLWAGRAVAGAAPALGKRAAARWVRHCAARQLVCRDLRQWAVPYIGDLIGSRLLHPVHARAFTANSFGTSGCKGTVQTLGALAPDITGWPAQAVSTCRWSSRRSMSTARRRCNRATTSLHCAQVLDNIGTPFETIDPIRRCPQPRALSPKPAGVYVWRADVTRRDMGGDVAALGAGSMRSVRLACRRACGRRPAFGLGWKRRWI